MRNQKITCNLLLATLVVMWAGRAAAQEAENLVACIEGQSILLAYGDLTDGCSIDAPGNDLDIFGFDGTAGDSVRFVLRSTSSSSMDPRIELLDPGNAVIEDRFCENNFCVVRFERALPATGFYTIRVSDSGGDNAGNYNFTLKRILPAGPPNVVPYDAPFLDSILPDVDIDAHGFYGTVGTDVRLTIRSSSSSTLNPRVEIYDPTGALVDEFVCTGIFCAANYQFSPAQTGLYTAYVSDQTSVFAGNYNFNIQCVFGPCDSDGDGTPDPEPSIIAYDDPLSDTIIPDVDIDGLRFCGEPGTTARLTIRSSTSSVYDPRVEIRDPSGAIVDEFSCTGTFCSVSYELAPTVSGFHSLLISDLGSVNSGTYNFNIQCITGDCDSDCNGTPDQPAPIIPFDAPISDSISLDVDMDPLRFYGEPGKTVRLSIRSTTSSSLDPRVEIRDPGDVLVDEFTCTSLFCNATYEFTPATSGYYSLLISDAGRIFAGNYNFNLQCVEGLCNDDSDRDGVQDAVDIALADDSARSSTISPDVDIDRYAFEGDPASPVRITLNSTTSSSFDPNIRLIGPDNMVIREDSCTGVFCTVMYDYTPTMAGPHRLLVSDLAGVNAGGYSLNVACTGFSCPPDIVVTTLPDNCKTKANGPLILDAGGNSQLDTNLDGFGNACDPDVSNNNTVDFVDLGMLKAEFFSAGPDTDFDGSGFVDFIDLGRMKEFFFGPPGPSGLPCAGTIPCPPP